MMKLCTVCGRQVEIVQVKIRSSGSVQGYRGVAYDDTGKPHKCLSKRALSARGQPLLPLLPFRKKFKA